MPKGCMLDLGPGVFGSLWRGFGVEQESSLTWNSAKVPTVPLTSGVTWKSQPTSLNLNDFSCELRRLEPVL